MDELGASLWWWIGNEYYASSSEKSTIHNSLCQQWKGRCWVMLDTGLREARGCGKRELNRKFLCFVPRWYCSSEKCSILYSNVAQPFLSPLLFTRRLFRYLFSWLPSLLPWNFNTINKLYICHVLASLEGHRPFSYQMILPPKNRFCSLGSKEQACCSPAMWSG